MNMRAGVKLVIVVIVAAVAWKYLKPSLTSPPAAATSAAMAAMVPLQHNACVDAGARASETWGSGLRNFVNPPYDVDAWSTFRASVESQIGNAESQCGGSDSSEKVRGAMRELRALVNDLDSAIRNGTAPPSDIVQRQESIDAQIDQARDVARAGK